MNPWYYIQICIEKQKLLVPIERVLHLPILKYAFACHSELDCLYYFVFGTCSNNKHKNKYAR